MQSLTFGTIGRPVLSLSLGRRLVGFLEQRRYPPHGAPAPAPSQRGWEHHRLEIPAITPDRSKPAVSAVGTNAQGRACNRGRDHRAPCRSFVTISSSLASSR